MAKDKWFKPAIKRRPPNSLNGWSKSQKASVRRRRALASRPKNWTRRHRYRSAGRALQALANVTQDKPTARKAKLDANYFFRKLKKIKK